jgi:HK97 gp10 family phage protein
MAGSIRKGRITSGSGKHPFGATAKVEGMDELIKELRAVKLNVNSSLRSAMRQGMKIVQDEAERNARAITKHKATRIEAVSRVKEGNVTVTLEIAKKRFYLGIVESGAKPHTIRPKKAKRLVYPVKVSRRKTRKLVFKRISHPGVRARPWLTPAWESKQQEAVAKVRSVLREVIEKKRAAQDNAVGGEG